MNDDRVAEPILHVKAVDVHARAFVDDDRAEVVDVHAHQHRVAVVTFQRDIGAVQKAHRAALDVDARAGSPDGRAAQAQFARPVFMQGLTVRPRDVPVQRQVRAGRIAEDPFPHRQLIGQRDRGRALNPESRSAFGRDRATAQGGRAGKDNRALLQARAAAERIGLRHDHFACAGFDQRASAADRAGQRDRCAGARHDSQIVGQGQRRADDRRALHGFDCCRCTLGVKSETRAG